MQHMYTYTLLNFYIYISIYTLTPLDIPLIHKNLKKHIQDQRQQTLQSLEATELRSQSGPTISRVLCYHL